MPFTATVCPHCGYDFPPPAEPRHRFTFESPRYDGLLTVGILVSSMASMTGTVRIPFALLEGKWIEGLFLLPILIVSNLALMVVFGRSYTK